MPRLALACSSETSTWLTPSRRARGPRGFTLLEVGIALLMLSLLLAVAIPSVNSLSGAYLRETTSRVQGLIRDTFARTALSGNSHRIVFDLEAQSFWVERTEGGVVMPREKLSLDNDGIALLDPVDERLSGTEDSDDEEDRAKRRLYAPPSWGKVEGEEGQPRKLHPDVRIFRAWADHLDEEASKGQVAISFFPDGYVQQGFVALTDDEDGDRVLAVITEPLTGETYVLDVLPRAGDFR